MAATSKPRRLAVLSLQTAANICVIRCLLIDPEICDAWFCEVYRKTSRAPTIQQNSAVIFVEKRTNHTLQKRPEKEKLDAKLDFWSISGGYIHRYQVQKHSTCHKKVHVPSHCSIFVVSGGQLRHFMCCRTVGLTITGSLMVTANYLGHGAVSLSSLSGKRLHTSGIHVVWEE